MSSSSAPEPREPFATVRVSVDFSDAEGIWVVVDPLYEGESIAASLEQASRCILDNLARDAGKLLAERHRYGKGLPTGR